MATSAEKIKEIQAQQAERKQLEIMSAAIAKLYKNKKPVDNSITKTTNLETVIEEDEEVVTEE